MWGLFWPAWIGLAEKRNHLNFFKSYFYIFGGHFKVFEVFHAKISRRFLESPIWILKRGHRFFREEISYFLLGEPLAMCKFFLEINLQLININGDTFTNFGGFLLIILQFSKKSMDQSQTFRCAFKLSSGKQTLCRGLKG